MCFVIFDEVARKTHGDDILYHPTVSPDLSCGIEQGLVKTAPTIRGLAQEIGADPEALETTLATYNINTKLGKEPEFGSTHFLEPIDKPPLYAIKCVIVRAGPIGGLKTNCEAQVINVHGKVIPRLYAVGSVTSLYKEYPGSGASLASIFVFGRIAGRNAAREALR
jgi:succinate dehydrogenase/fumarate reductase flavoprotein subunit